MLGYAIVTPAHNEEAFIERTIQSVIVQTVLPLKWVVVDDGSTDRTADIVESYSSRHPFISLVKVRREVGRDFGKKVNAFNRGLVETENIPYYFVGNLDADISLGRDYFENILREFEKDSRLGIAGGMVYSRIGDEFVSQEVAPDSVAGAVQLFRRECFEQIGGYTALPFGGIDAAAEITARMKGWTVRTFPEQRALEYRRTGTATARPLAARMREGGRMYSLGYGILFFGFRCLYRSMERPRIIGSVAALIGYLAALIRRDTVVLPLQVVEYLKSEQREKLLRIAKLLRSRKM
jgi:poly-beta-1,6-N-acetyl-D-glucosamine synthase